MKRKRRASRASGPRALERGREGCDRPRQRHRLRDEERAELDAAEACRAQVVEHVVERVLPRVQVEHELPLRVPGRVSEERPAVARVVDRSEDGRRGHRAGREVVVQVADLDRCAVAEPPSRLVRHLRRRVDAAVAEAPLEQEVAEAAVAAGEVEHLVARLEPGAESDDQVRAVGEVGASVGVRTVGPRIGLPRVLLALAHNASSRSGCLRTNRAIPRACQSVCRDRNRLSMTAA